MRCQDRVTASQITDLLIHTVPEDARAQVDTMLVGGSDGVLFGRPAGRVRAAGRSFEGPFALRSTVENGRITRHHLSENSASIAAACTA